MQVWSLYADLRQLDGTRKIFIADEREDGETALLVPVATHVDDFGNLVISARRAMP